MALINAYASYGNFEYAREVRIISSNLCLSFRDEIFPVDVALCLQNESIIEKCPGSQLCAISTRVNLLLL